MSGLNTHKGRCYSTVFYFMLLLQISISISVKQTFLFLVIYLICLHRAEVVSYLCMTTNIRIEMKSSECKIKLKGKSSFLTTT